MNDSKEILQQKLYESILNHGGTDKRTVEISQALDIIVAAEQRALTRFNTLGC
jgi:hypothetical protein